MLLGIKTDNPEAELYLVAPDGVVLGQLVWHADRQLAQYLLKKITELLDEQKTQLHELRGIIVFQGPGSFTGLRIGITVANTLGQSLSIPMVGMQGNDWLALGVQKIAAGDAVQLVLPEYGSPARITTQKK